MSLMTDPFDERVRRALQRRAARIGPPDDALGDIHRRARRQRRVRRGAVSLAVIAVLGLGAAAALPLATRSDVVLDPGSEPSTPAASPEATPADEAPAAGTSTCEGSERGVTFRIHYPDTWWASDGTPAEPCHWFHPEPYDMPSEARDVPGVAIHIDVIDTPFDELRRLDPETEELLSESEITVDGRPAVVQEHVSHTETLYPSGTRFSRFLVQVDGRTLLGTAAEGSSADYTDSTAALDQIVADLEVLRVGSASSDPHADTGACSAEGHPFPPESQEGLPLQVAETRSAIVEAAVACDEERLAELAGETFTYSFGGGDDFAGFLRRGEERTPRPLRYLVELLDRPYETIEVQGQTQYVWPSAFAYDNWDEVPEADREALEPLYDEEDFARFARFGGYTGYRIGISADGRWLFFVAGD